MKAIANPVEVEYGVIESIPVPDVGTLLDEPNAHFYVHVRWHPDFAPKLEKIDSGMSARYVPIVGDYLVVQSDGYRYINPKEVFERKYRKADGGAW